ncbi:MAG: hypothetical protein MZV64_49280 [Ignavibacteriales bacterium]|nr:hypothetical protein [Ignavibacteriales bacterium]
MNDREEGRDRPKRGPRWPRSTRSSGSSCGRALTPSMGRGRRSPPPPARDA